MPASPVRARIHMYQVGFGDCFLLTFEYDQPLNDGRDKRNILFDFGSTRYPVPGFKMESIAALVESHCGPNGQLDVLVATHRHKDHISGFGQAKARKIIDRLQPRTVIRSWTEEPDIAEEAIEPGPAFAAHLSGGQEFARQLVARLRRVQAELREDPQASQLMALAFDELANQEALDQMKKWSEGGRARYVHAGVNPKLEDILPGVSVSVLGPPTVKQYCKIKGQVDDRPDYWLRFNQLLANPLRAATFSADGPGADVPPGASRRLVERLHDHRMRDLLSIVRTLDDALNNTSVILLIEAGSKKLLFSGDAQGENWDFALGQAANLKLLRDVDFYKVGHHGSRNATPRKLVDLWNEAPVAQRRPMTAMMSTLPGVHGEPLSGTEVPRDTLIKALAARTDFHRTDKFKDGQLFVEVVADLTDQTPFQLVP